MTVCWTELEIQTCVTREFVVGKLRPEEQALLDQSVAFGDGLTDDTYIDWILEKAKKLFLILLDIGVPDQVFGVIDDSFDDDDLPLSYEAVSQLRLSFDKDEALNKKFYRTQYNYLIKYLNAGDHGQYDTEEVVPVEVVKRRPEVLPHHSTEKVHLLGRPRQVYAQRRLSIGCGAGAMPEEDFRSEVDAIKNISHEHIMSLWCSYTQGQSGYILLTPAPEISLKAFLADVPPEFKKLPKAERRDLLLNWPHCLADAVAFLHCNGYAHQDLRPSNIFIDGSHKIFLGDMSSMRLKPQHQPRKLDTEAYEYAAPEQWVKTPVLQHVPPPKSILPGGGRTGRKISVSQRYSPKRISYVSDVASLASYDTRAPSTADSTVTGYSSSSSSSGSTAIVQKFRSLPTDPQRSDIFSLACVTLDILTHLLKCKQSRFISHRSSKNRLAGRGGAPADASFHANLAQVHSWIDVLDKAAFKRDEGVFTCMPPMLEILYRMLDRNPKARPTAQEVERRLDDSLFHFGRMERPHCGKRHFATFALAEEAQYSVQTAALRSSENSVNKRNRIMNRESAIYGIDDLLDFEKGRLMSVSSEPGGMMAIVGRSESKSSKSSGSTVRIRTWPLPGGTDDMLDAFMSHD